MWSVTCEREIIRDGEFLQKFRQRKIGFTENGVELRNNVYPVYLFRCVIIARKSLRYTLKITLKRELLEQ